MCDINTCPCGHDLDDEHRLVEQQVYDGAVVVRVCDVCDVDCRTLVGEREAWEEKVRQVNELAKRNLGMK